MGGWNASWHMAIAGRAHGRRSVFWLLDGAPSGGVPGGCQRSGMRLNQVGRRRRVRSAKSSRQNSNTLACAQAPQGVVLVHATDEDAFAQVHEQDTRATIARQLAALKGYIFAGKHEPRRRYSGPVYLVPSDTLVGLEAARALGVNGEHDLFGGVVPHAFVATKVITHPLVADTCPGPRRVVAWLHGPGAGRRPGGLCRVHAPRMRSMPASSSAGAWAGAPQARRVPPAAAASPWSRTPPSWKPPSRRSTLPSSRAMGSCWRRT